MEYKVLIIEDEKKIRKILRDFFELEKFHVVEAEDGEEGQMMFQYEKPDVVILDIMMPKIDGWSVCRKIRKISDVPIIILTARDDQEDVLYGFEMRADDYVIKPFNPQVIVAKAKMLLRRTHGTVIEEKNTLEIDGVVINKLSRHIEVDGEVIKSTQKEFELLLYLMENKNNVLPRENILDKVWGYDYYGDLRVVDNYIRKLRKLLGEKSYTVVTVFGVGYKFEGNE